MTQDFDEGRYLLPALLEEVADQLPERCHLVWADETSPGGHPYRAVCGYNASLSFEWGRISASAPNDDSFETDWSQKYPDHEVRLQDLDILLHGARIYRLSIALVDGAGCWIPFPAHAPDGEGYAVSEWATSVVRLANELVHGTTDTLEYVKRADIKVVKLPPLAE